MRIDKELQKKCITLIKEKAVSDGYKKTQNTIYIIDDSNIIFADYMIVNSKDLIYRINIKKKSYDNIFWEIMGMEDNIKKSDSLRVSGAFTAPSVLIAKGTIELSEDIDFISENFLYTVNQNIKDFINKKEVGEYIFSGEVVVDADILQCLEYIDSGTLSKAKELAEEKINLGDTGRFENEGKGFFERVLAYTA